MRQIEDVGNGRIRVNGEIIVMKGLGSYKPMSFGYDEIDDETQYGIEITRLEDDGPVILTSYGKDDIKDRDADFEEMVKAGGQG